MRAALQAAVLCIVLVLGALVLVAPKAAADWCSSSFMTVYPTSGPAGSPVTISFTFENFASATIQVSDFSASYSWGGSSYFGVFVVPPYGTITGTSTQTLPATAGSESLYAAVTGQANTDYFPIYCSFGPMAFTVYAPTPVSAAATANPTTTDVGLAVSFGCTASGGSPPYTYAWAFGDGTTGSGAPASHAYASAGTKTATCTATDGALAHATATASVVVHPTPAVAVTSTGRAAAPGTPLPFAALASGGSGSFTYTWSFGDGATGTGANLSHAYAAPGNFTAIVTATDSVGGTASASVPIGIASLVPSAAVSTTSAAIGMNLTFTASASGGAGPPYTFRWTFGDGTTATGATAYHTYGTPGNYTVTLRVTDALGATNGTTLPTVRIPSAPTHSPTPPGGTPSLGPTDVGLYLAAGILVAVAVVAAVWLLLRRRRKADTGPPREPPTS